MNWQPITETPQHNGDYLVREVRQVTYKEEENYKIIKKLCRYRTVKYASNLHEIPCDTPYPHAIPGFYDIDPNWGIVVKVENITHWAKIDSPEI